MIAEPTASEPPYGPTYRAAIDELIEAGRDVAVRFTGLALHGRRPVDKQGDRSPRAWVWRQQEAHEAAAEWLEIQAKIDALNAGEFKKRGMAV